MSVHITAPKPEAASIALAFTPTGRGKPVDVSFYVNNKEPGMFSFEASYSSTNTATANMRPNSFCAYLNRAALLEVQREIAEALNNDNTDRR